MDDDAPFVPPGFDPPPRLETELFVLEPLGPEHNERDHAAWSSSIEHIHATPGWEGRKPESWPHPMTSAENLGDLEMHARHFRDRAGFTYTVLDPSDDDVIGCVYVYPDETGATAAQVRSWVRASHATLDAPLRGAVRAWLLSDAWPFATIAYGESERLEA